ncbi:hypothetical protein [Niabella ginsengisoli]|uniref:Uncharacterized protein n=1 Tax=Niabella ginsengisoli TaxID=522298 RepID=A0ABS9SGM6_9BACT|nr:hypothetical protein [Niabella ginsengisoli]MCH5597471.1 hypothetical protein [Niabella ginsengisoli]
MRLIGMDRYELGDATLNGSGESSVNLLTGDYIGDWNYYDPLANNEAGELIKIPTIKTKMYFGKIYLEAFSDAVYYDFEERCAKLYYQEKEKECENEKISHPICSWLNIFYTTVFVSILFF